MPYVPASNDPASCRDVITLCDQHYGWHLDGITRERYVRALTPLLADVPSARRTTIVLNYHLDHRVVAALRDARNPAHNDAWTQWSAQVLAILRRNSLDWSRDGSVDSEDLAQMARGDLARALPSYGYQSRFLSWAYSVVVRSVQRHVRAVQAQRRAAPVTSLEHLSTPLPAEEETLQPEHAAHASLLAEQVHTVLSRQSDPRLPAIFRLWAIEDRTSAEIGALVNLHESRVRALLKQARTVLAGDAAIQQWRALPDDDSTESDL